MGGEGEIRSEGTGEKSNGVVGGLRVPRQERRQSESQLQQLRFTIPSLPPSMNSLYYIIYSQKKVELRPEARKWKSDAKGYVPRFQPENKLLVAVDTTFYYPFHYANGKPRILDAPNLLKLLIDAIAEKCGFNDCLVRYGSWSSVDSASEKVEIVLREIEA